MKKCHWLGLILLLLVAYGQAQDRIVTHNDFTAHTLVKDIFASGACDNIDLINPIGHPQGVGYFENGLASIGLDRGIILSTGPTHHAAGPNSETDKSGDLPGVGNDGDLSGLSTGAVKDAVGIEFDFVPLDSIVRFRYVFASEEYCEFVGSSYNDVFGFFVSGPGIDGEFVANAENVALIPGTNDFVAINSVNSGQNSDFYIHNERPEDQSDCGLTNIATPHLDAIQYDGFTTILTAELVLRPCETYHIRLVVGDVGDEHFDSAVFLEAGSFNLGGEIAVTSIGNSAGAGQLFEGCEDAVFRFSRASEGLLDHPLSVHYELSLASTATPGLDFEPLPGQVTIPAGAAYVDLPVRSLPDLEMEDEEFIRLVLDIPCACYADSADLVIVPPPTLGVELEDAWTCPGEDALLTAQPIGGISPYQFQWSAGGNTVTQTVPAEAGAVHQVTVTDACQQEANALAMVELTTPPRATLSGNAQICQGDTAWLSLALEGVPPFTIGYERNGEENWLQLTTVNDFPALLAGSYRLTSISDAACIGTVSGTAVVAVWGLEVTANVINVSCADGADGALSLQMEAGEAPFMYTWQHDGSTTDELTGLTPGYYEVFVSDARGCTRSFDWTLTAPPFLVAPEVDCAALFAGEIIATAAGGLPPYTYQFEEDGLWASAADWLNGLWPGEHYDLTIRDANGCQISVPWIMPGIYPDGMAALPSPIELPLGLTAPVAWENYVPDNLLAALNWQPADQLSCSDCATPEITARHSGTLQLQIEDIFGCSQELSAELIVEDRVDAFLPNVFSPNGDDQNDLWLLFGNPLQIERIEELLIFDRWGNMLFHATDWPINSTRHGWDGTFRGQALDPGVYAYSIRFRLVNGEKRTLGGDVLLLR